MEKNIKNISMRIDWMRGDSSNVFFPVEFGNQG